MMFKKGSFEVGGVIYPVAIKVGLCVCIFISGCIRHGVNSIPELELII